MRQLKISKQSANPAREAEHAAALLHLRQLAAAQPLGLAPNVEAQWLRWILSVAKQYQGRGATLVELVAAGYTAQVRCVERGVAEKWWSWWMRQRIIAAQSKSTLK